MFGQGGFTFCHFRQIFASLKEGNNMSAGRLQPNDSRRVDPELREAAYNQ